MYLWPFEVVKATHLRDVLCVRYFFCGEVQKWRRKLICACTPKVTQKHSIKIHRTFHKNTQDMSWDCQSVLVNVPINNKRTNRTLITVHSLPGWQANGCDGKRVIVIWRHQALCQKFAWVGLYPVAKVARAFGYRQIFDWNWNVNKDKDFGVMGGWGPGSGQCQYSGDWCRSKGVI